MIVVVGGQTQLRHAAISGIMLSGICPPMTNSSSEENLGVDGEGAGQVGKEIPRDSDWRVGVKY